MKLATGKRIICFDNALSIVAKPKRFIVCINGHTANKDGAARVIEWLEMLNGSVLPDTKKAVYATQPNGSFTVFHNRAGRYLFVSELFVFFFIDQFSIVPFSFPYSFIP